MGRVSRRSCARYEWGHSHRWPRLSDPGGNPGRRPRNQCVRRAICVHCVSGPTYAFIRTQTCVCVCVCVCVYVCVRVTETCARQYAQTYLCKAFEAFERIAEIYPSFSLFICIEKHTKHRLCRTRVRNNLMREEDILIRRRYRRRRHRWRRRRRRRRRRRWWWWWRWSYGDDRACAAS